jgi:hypothetical protein
MSLQSLWTGMTGIALPVYPAGHQMPIVDGQSLALGVNGSVDERKVASYQRRAGVKMLAGLVRSDAAPAYLHGPATLTYGAAAATGIVAASPAANIPVCHSFAVAVDAWRRALGAPLRRMLIGFNGIAGQSVDEFDDDSPTPGGALGTLIRDNHARWLTEARTLDGTAAPLCYALLQGEADVTMTREQYLAAATESIGDALDDIQAATGTRPPVLVWQTGGYLDSTGKAYGPPLAQIDLVAALDGVFAGPIYPSILMDTVHPTLASQRLWAEIGAYVWVRREQGANVNLLPGTPSVVGNQITIPFSTEAGAALVFDGASPYPTYGGLTDHGCEVSGTTVTAVDLIGNAVRITAGAALSGRTVSIAMQVGDRSNALDGLSQGMAAHRCDIMEADPRDSLIISGAKLRRFIPSCRWTV